MSIFSNDPLSIQQQFCKSSPEWQRLTVYEPFWENLANLDRATVPNNYRTISASAMSTLATEAPYAYLGESYKALTELAKDELDQIANSSRMKRKMPQEETTHYLGTESDVLRASFLYLVHPVNVAVSRLTNDRIYCCSEVTSGDSRTDIRWIFSDSQGNQNIAILEFKNTQVLHFQDFERARARANTAREKRDAGVFAQSGTLFECNGEVIAKQAKKYSKICPDVAVFDWGNMFIFDFSNVDEDATDPHLYRRIWFTETEQRAIQGQTFRTLTLGFLIRAL